MSVTPIKKPAHIKTIADINHAILVENARILGESAAKLALQSAELLTQAKEIESAQVVLESAKWIHGEFFKLKQGQDGD